MALISIATAGLGPGKLDMDVGEGRHWPRIFLLGTQKGATTSLARAFEKAGACSSGQGKEASVLANDGLTNDLTDGNSLVGAYTKIFADSDLTHDNCLAGHYDGNPFLLTDVGAPIFVSRFMPANLKPNVRLVACLREPTSRMLSWHNHHRHTGPDPKIFADHVAEEVALWTSNGKKGIAQNGVKNWWDVNMEKWDHKPPLDMMVSMYRPALARWRKHWARKQSFIMNFRNFADHTAEHMRALGSFLSLDLGEPLMQLNVHSEDTEAISKMCCETFCALQHAAFNEFNNGLYQMLETDAAQMAAPPQEPAFGRFEIPPCVACDSTSTPEAVLATCTPPAQPKAGLAPINSTSPKQQPPPGPVPANQPRPAAGTQRPLPAPSMQSNAPVQAGMNANQPKAPVPAVQAPVQAGSAANQPKAPAPAGQAPVPAKAPAPAVQAAPAAKQLNAAAQTKPAEQKAPAPATQKPLDPATQQPQSLQPRN